MITCPSGVAKRLVVLELNGLLCHRTLESTIICPGVGQFLALLFECFHVAVWTTTTRTHGQPLVDQIFGDYVPSLVFIWYRRQTRMVDSLIDWDRVKPLELISHFNSKWNQSNVVIIDDNPQKVRTNPPFNSLIVQEINYHELLREIIEKFP